jgi:hypothetical protein
MSDTTALTTPAPAVSFPRLAVLRITLVAVIACSALAIRLVNLDRGGFNEDEINKWTAVQAYSRGDFTANAEHPMLMKLAAWASVSAARAWNERPALGWITTIEPEAALRLPNVVIGSATAVVLFLLGDTLFGTAVGMWAAAFWALDVNAAAINRIAKEDTFLVFFLMTAAYLYERRRFAASTATFGLMLASKYMPHYIGLHAAYAFAADPAGRLATAGRLARRFAIFVTAFIGANFAVLIPQTWSYVASFVQGESLRHSGYVFAGRTYVNAISTSPWGQPVWFYLTYFAAKVPVVILALAAGGLWWTWRHPERRGAVFIRVFLIPTLLAYSLVSGKFLRYMLPVLVILNLAAAIGMAALLRRIAAPVVAGATVVMMLLINVVWIAPDYSLAQNLIGALIARPGALFPDDEFLDAGVREATGIIARSAAAGAVVCSETPNVVREYLERFGRGDVGSCGLSSDGIPMQASDVWAIVQDGHVYFENASTIDSMRRRLQPAATVAVRGVTAAAVYHVVGAPR